MVHGPVAGLAFPFASEHNAVNGIALTLEEHREVRFAPALMTVDPDPGCPSAFRLNSASVLNTLPGSLLSAFHVDQSGKQEPFQQKVFADPPVP